MKIGDIKKVGVVGAGVMGHGLAINSALWGYPTIMHDLNDEILQDAIKNIKSILSIFIDEELIDHKWGDETVKRITPTNDLQKLAKNSDFITEAIIEKSEDKRALFKELGEICPPHTILASNTSSLVLSDFGRDCNRQDKLVLTHYFSPPSIVPGVEVAKGPGTSDETFEITCELMKKWHKVPIRVLKEVPGYLINRLQFALAQEALKLWADGLASAEEIDKGVRATMGFRMTQEGPLKRSEMAGVWSWPKELRVQTRLSMMNNGLPTIEQLEKIRKHWSEGKPWFVDPKNMWASYEPAYRYYAARLKNDYWSHEK
jgi:3-hydroxyacyl-CoA dehydrogenase